MFLTKYQFDFFVNEQFSNLTKVNFFKQQKIPKQEVKALYLTAYSAGLDSKTDQIIDLMEKTELNAVVIDIKDYTGFVLYDSNLPIVNEFGLEKNLLGDLKKIIKKFHEKNIYVIARQTVFQDPILAEKKDDWAIKNKFGGIWRDYKGLSWVDPSKKDVWKYNLDIAREATKFGFDEINFDYVRFPSDGDLNTVFYENQTQNKNEIMADFFSYLDESLKNYPVWISIDFFGFVMERQDGMSIGQTLAGAIDKVDFICPMMYPSHYPSGHLGLQNPADYPYLVIDNGMKKAENVFKNSKRTQVRPWIQAFNIGAVYDAEKIRAQIDAIEKYDNNGFMLWNAANRYTEAGLKQEN
ncbi:MAG: putative glycoside hydrolase [Patescibacteria group bacterium]